MSLENTTALTERESSAQVWRTSHTVSVVIPALNWRHVLPLIRTWVHEVILVDGPSTDGAVAVAREVLPTICIVLWIG